MLPDGDVSGMKEVVVKKEGNTTYIRRVRFKSEPAKGAVAAMEIKEAPETFEVPEIVSAEADPGEVVATDTGACGAPQQMTSQLTSPVSETETARSTERLDTKMATGRTILGCGGHTRCRCRGRSNI